MVKIRKKLSLAVITGLAAMLLLLMGTGAAFAETGDIYVPVKISEGFNVDAIYDKDSGTSACIDFGYPGYVYYYLDDTEGSLPESGLIKLNGEKQYFQLADYDKNNVLRLSSEKKTGSLSFDTGSQTVYKDLIILMTGGNGGGRVKAVVHYSDGTQSEEDLKFTVPDWDIGDSEDEPEGLAYRCGRCGGSGDRLETSPDFGLFASAIPGSDLDQPVAGIDFEVEKFSDDTKSTVCIFGVSGIENTEQYTVMFDSNGGTCDTSFVKGAENDTIKLPAASRYGHTFTGWSDGVNTYEAGADYTIGGNAVLTAQWKENDYILLDPNHDKLKEYKLFRNEDRTWPHPERDSYDFAGFQDSKGNMVEDNDLILKDTYKATWKLDPEKLSEIDLWIEGVQVTKDNCSDILSEDPENRGKVSYDFNTNTLTLNGASLESVPQGSDEDAEESGAIYYTQKDIETLTVDLVGKNTIKDETEAENCQGICVYNADFIIKGKGSLGITENTEEETYSIYCDSDYATTIEADISFSGRSEDILYPISCGDLCISNAHISMKGIKGYEVCGIDCDSAVIKGSALEIEVTADHTYAEGIQASKGVEIVDSKLTIDTEGIHSTNGIYSKRADVIIDHSQIELTAYSKDSTTGIKTDRGNVEIVDSKLTIDTEGIHSAYGIKAEDEIEATDSIVTVTADSAGKCYGMDTMDLDLEGVTADIKANNVEGTGSAYGIASIGTAIVDGDSTVRTAGRSGYRGSRDLELSDPLCVGAGSIFESIGTDQALEDADLSDATKNLGAKVKEDLNDEYAPWDGETDLSSDEFTAVYIPGKQVGHVEAFSSCTAKGNIEYWTVTDREGTTYYNNSMADETHQISPEDTITEIDPNAHDWGEWKTTRGATTKKEGLETRVCRNDKTHIEQRAIPKWDGPAAGPGASAACADEAITSATSDIDPAGSTMAPLRLKSTKQTKKSVKLSWTRVSGAASYVVYGNVCGGKNKMKKLKTLKTGSFNVKKIKKKLKKGTYYKFVVVALDKNNTVLSTSKMIHAATSGGKVGNHKSIKVKASVLKKARTLGQGKTLKLGAKALAKSKKLKVKKHAAIRYESSNPAIAAVTAKGVVKGSAKGSCYIYAYAQNGVCKKITVTVR